MRIAFLIKRGPLQNGLQLETLSTETHVIQAGTIRKHIVAELRQRATGVGQNGG